MEDIMATYKGKRNPNYKHGRFCNEYIHKCKDCGKILGKD